MKNFIIGFALLVTLSACSKTIHTHEEVMQSFRTKGDVIKQFGSPDEIAKNVGVTTWMYNFDAKAKRTLPDTSHSAASDTVGTNVPLVANFTLHKRYILFFFDQQGNVLSCNSYGVNLAERKSKPVQTFFLVIGLAAVVIFFSTAKGLPLGYGE